MSIKRNGSSKKMASDGSASAASNSWYKKALLFGMISAAKAQGETEPVAVNPKCIVKNT